VVFGCIVGVGGVGGRDEDRCLDSHLNTAVFVPFRKYGIDRSSCKIPKNAVRASEARDIAHIIFFLRKRIDPL